MATVATQELALDTPVEEFLKRHDAENDLRTVHETVHFCFSDLRGVEVRVQEDPDEVGRASLVLHVLLSESHPADLLQRELKQYHERLVEVLPLSRCPLFAVVTEFMRD